MGRVPSACTWIHPEAVAPGDVAVSRTVPPLPIPYVTVTCADAEGPMVTEPADAAQLTAPPSQVAARVYVAAVVPVFQIVNVCGRPVNAVPPAGSIRSGPVDAGGGPLAGSALPAASGRAAGVEFRPADAVGRTGTGPFAGTAARSPAGGRAGEARASGRPVARRRTGRARRFPWIIARRGRRGNPGAEHTEGTIQWLVARGASRKAHGVLLHRPFIHHKHVTSRGGCVASVAAVGSRSGVRR